MAKKQKKTDRRKRPRKGTGKLKPTPREKSILDVIRHWRKLYKMAPTHEEIAKALKISKSTVATYLKRLQKKNLVDWKVRSPRTLRIL